MIKKQSLGQFYTTNNDYIVGNLLDIFDTTKITIDPFAGNWDLLNMLDDKYEKMGFDIDPKNEDTIELDTLLFNPGCYEDNYIFTNPPYLARNKSDDKLIFEKYQVDDLYKAALKSIDTCEGGAIIVPLNFLSSKDSLTREDFLSKFKIKKMNIFEEPVFEDTTYTVCSFSFYREENIEQIVEFNFYPSGAKISCLLKKDEGYTLGFEFNRMCSEKSKIKVSRLLKDQEPTSKIFLRALDTGTMEGRICLSLKDEPYFGINTDRAFATISFSKSLSLNQQEIIVKDFNLLLEGNREKYRSMFLSSFRNSTQSYSRKRIAFDDAYGLIHHIIKNHKFDEDIQTTSDVLTASK